MIRTTLIVAVLGFTAVAHAQPAGAEEPAPPPEGAGMPSPDVVTPAPTPTPGVVAPTPEPTSPGRPKRKLTVMWAPLRLIVPLVEFTAEYRVANKIGVAVLVGGGKRELTGLGTEVSGTEFEVGGQFRFYAVGSFDHGMNVGIELLEEYVNFGELPPNTAAAAGGLTVGPFIGYKIATRSGFTFEAQAGARYLVMEPGVQGDMSIPFELTESKWLPILHINFGWSF